MSETTTAAGMLTGVGIGPGAVRYLTLEAVEVLRAADVIIDVAGPRSKESVSERVIDELGGCEGERVHFVTPMSKDLAGRSEMWQERAREVLDWIRAGKRLVYVTLGDPLIYSTFGYLRRELLQLDPEVKINVVPGITSFQAAAARTGEPLLENEEVLSIIPATADAAQREAVLRGTDTAVFLKASRNKAAIFEQVNTALDAKSFLYASRLESPDEVVSTDPVQAADLPDTYLSLFISRRVNHDL
jgi:precorrin-2/cobalt-factor-2 C20-methyltransferase